MTRTRSLLASLLDSFSLLTFFLFFDSAENFDRLRRRFPLFCSSGVLGEFLFSLGKCKFMQITSIKTFRLRFCEQQARYDLAKMGGRV